MTMGRVPRPGELGPTAAYCDGTLPPTSIYGLLYRESHHLFPDHAFADVFASIGRGSVPPRIVAVVMVLQRLEGLSDREAVDRFVFDVRWKYAAGGLPLEYPGFAHTVLVDMRERLRTSKDPDRVFRIVADIANAAGLVGHRRVLDSTPLYDAVATQDTVTMIRASIRGLLRVADAELGAALRAVLKRDDDYAHAGKPVCDWEDKAAREALIDELARDAYAALTCLHDRKVSPEVEQAGKLVATVVGQDLEQTADGTFRIAKKVAKDRVISTVDPEARHGHKTNARNFDGYKGHIAIDPDSEIITAAEVTAANVGDGSITTQLLQDAVPTVVIPGEKNGAVAAETTTPSATDQKSAGAQKSSSEPVEVYGDASYGTAENLKYFDAHGVVPNVKVQPPAPPHEDLFSQDAFDIDSKQGTVRCPQGVVVQLRLNKDDRSVAEFGAHCQDCPLRSKCTKSKTGRTISIHPEYERLQQARTRQRDPAWKRNYRATRPKVERKLAHLMRRKHGGRRARMRGRERVARDFLMLCGAVNLKRLAELGLRSVEVQATSGVA